LEEAGTVSNYFRTLIKMCTRYITERIFDCSECSQATLKRLAQIYVTRSDYQQPRC